MNLIKSQRESRERKAERVSVVQWEELRYNPIEMQPDYSMFMSPLFLLLVGSGRWSLDAILSPRRPREDRGR